LSRFGALPVKSLELVLEKRRRSGALSPASALAILQKTPPAMVLTHDQTQATATIYSPNLQPLNRPELFGTPLRERSKKFHQSPVGAKKFNVPGDAAKTGGK
jgi:hypothetical protein